MKKITLLMLIILASCSKQESTTETVADSNLNYYDKAYIETASLNEQLEYKRFHLKKIANWLLKNDFEVYEILSQELTNTKEDNFYVGNIYADIISKGSKNLWNEDDITLSLTAFENLDGDDAYPALYLPNIERYINRVPYDSIKPLYAVDDYDEINQVQIMAGYQEDVNKELQPIDEPLVPGIADEEDIIVLSLRPCTDPIGGNNGNKGVGCDTGGGGGGGGQSNDIYHINKMTIKENKEPWPARSDVSLVGFKTLGLPYESGPCGYSIVGASDCLNEPEGRFIKEFKRSWISGEEEQTVGHLIDSYYNPNNVDIYYALVIFERDNWPAGKKTAEIQFPYGMVRTAEFRSWENEYHKVLVKNNNENQGVPRIEGYNQDNSEIRYNLN